MKKQTVPWTALTCLLLLYSPALTATEGFMGAQEGSTYEIPRYSIDAGGVLSATGGLYSLNGTLGQPDTTIATGGSYTLTGGFWTKSVEGPGGKIFCDGFEIGDTSNWSYTQE